jgi:hypothetical protein
MQYYIQGKQSPHNHNFILILSKYYITIHMHVVNGYMANK